MRYVAYCRVSGTKQENDKQERYHFERAAELGLVAVVVQEKKSGASLERQVKDLIVELQPGDILSFWMTSRFGRPKPEDIGVYFEWAKAARGSGATIEIDRKVLDTTSVDGARKFFEDLTRAYEERIEIVRRTMAGKVLARETGNYRNNGWVPYGFRKKFAIDEDTGRGVVRYEHCPEEVTIVQELYQWVIAGNRLQSFCDKLNIEGKLKVKRGRGKGKLGEWSKSGLQFILFNPINMGFTFLKQGQGERVAARRLIIDHLEDMSIFREAVNYPPIVSPGIYWRAVSTYASSRKSIYTNYTRQAEDPYTRTVYCWWCARRSRSSALYLNHSKKRDTNKAYFRFNNILKGCQSHRTIRADSFREMLPLAVQFVFQEATETSQYVEVLLANLNDSKRESALAEIDQVISEKQNQLAKWRDNLRKVDDPEIVDSWLAKMSAIEDDVLRLNQTKIPLLRDNRLEEIRNIQRDFEKSTWAKFNQTEKFEERREVLRKLLKRAWVNGPNLVFVFKNSKVVRFLLPHQAPGFRPKQVFPFTVGFHGKLQLVGEFSPQQQIVKIAVSRTIRDDLREAFAVNYGSVDRIGGTKTTLLTYKRTLVSLSDLETVALWKQIGCSNVVSPKESL